MRNQLVSLRALMQKNHIDIYLVQTDDFHASEYTGDYFKTRAYLTGFTGSAGTAVVTQTWAGCWTDGRYFLQAAQQLNESGFELMRQGEPDVPTIRSWLETHLKAGMVLGFDGRTVSANIWKQYTDIAVKAGATLNVDLDLIDAIWPDRPPLSAEPVFELGLEYTGQSRSEKIKQIRTEVRKLNGDAFLLSSLMDICWMLNIRGGDVACTPVVLSYLILTDKSVRLYINETTLSAEIRMALETDGVEIYPYSEILNALHEFPAGSHIVLNPDVVSCALYQAIPENCIKIEHKNPTELAKAIKNPVEVENFRKAHIKDGVAVTRFMYWLKHEIGKTPMDEISVAEKLDSFRKEQEHYQGQSFHPIMAYGAHGAIVHYSATCETCSELQPRSFFLSDTGGHYLEGTTDITRTYAMGPLSDKEKLLYTKVLIGHLRLGDAHFRYGCTGMQLDYLAHEPLWRMHLDYNHGTGHGVGYLLSVHEGPQGFYWNQRGTSQPAKLEPGMIISDEPGVYLENEFGVRLENLVVVCEDETNKYGRFMHLEYLTMVPWDLDAVDLSVMTEEDKQLLDAYHQKVYQNISPYLSPEEAEWLKYATRPVAEHTV